LTRLRLPRVALPDHDVVHYIHAQQRNIEDMFRRCHPGAVDGADPEQLGYKGSGGISDVGLGV
jgi:hypothetical protein